ncbi:hypothetical protein OAC97_02170 [Flavobacteriaceae bacterium]|nr:hypothetical protein [Flavobacteriaceae bacterium]
MAVKFSEFSQKPNITEVTEIVGYYASSDLNVRIVPSALDTNYAYSTTDGASPALTLVGTKAGVSTTTEQVTLSGLGGTILAGTGTNAISFTSTTYALAAGVNADPAVNTPITLTGLTGGDAHTDTVNLIGTGTVQITSAGGVITIDGGSTADVTSFTNSNGGTFVAYGTVNTAATGAVTIGDVDLTASGTASATTFLRGDNQWATPAGGTDTTYDLTGTTSGSSVDVNLVPSTGTTDTLKLTPAGGLTITQAAGVITLDTSASGSGTVTSVGMTMPGAFAVAGSPVTTTGTLAVTTTGGSAGQFLDYTGAWATPPGGAPTKTVDTATIANATTGTFTLTATPSSENYVDMYISGVYQSKTTYTVAGTTVTLDGGTFFPNGAVVETVTTT